MVHLQHFFIHLVKVVFNELVDNLLWQINPDVEDPLLLFLFESIL